MTFAFGKASLKRQEGLHPHLIAVLNGAIKISEVDFAIVCGVRTVEEQERLYAQGRTTAELRAKGLAGIEGDPHKPKVTWTMNSNHFKRDSGYGHAVDVAPYINGKIVWDDIPAFNKIADAMLRIAAEMAYPVTWGGHWSKNIDRPHFELPRAYT